jgi:hypothetical protein
VKLDSSKSARSPAMLGARQLPFRGPNAGRAAAQGDRGVFGEPAAVETKDEDLSLGHALDQCRGR